MPTRTNPMTNNRRAQHIRGANLTRLGRQEQQGAPPCFEPEPIVSPKRLSVIRPAIGALGILPELAMAVPVGKTTVADAIVKILFVKTTRILRASRSRRPFIGGGTSRSCASLDAPLAGCGKGRSGRRGALPVGPSSFSGRASRRNWSRQLARTYTEGATKSEWPGDARHSEGRFS